MVMEKVNELGYQPLRKKRIASSEIIVAIPNTKIYTFGNTLNFLSSHLSHKNYDIRLVNLQLERVITKGTALSLCEKKPAGIILYGCYVEEESAEIFAPKRYQPSYAMAFPSTSSP